MSQRAKQAKTTYVWALAGGSSTTTSAGENVPTFEVNYAGLPGVNADQFEPVIVRLSPAPQSNFRLVGATEAATTAEQSTQQDWPIYSSFMKIASRPMCKNLAQGTRWSRHRRPGSQENMPSHSDPLTNPRSLQAKTLGKIRAKACCSSTPGRSLRSRRFLSQAWVHEGGAMTMKKIQIHLSASAISLLLIFAGCAVATAQTQAPAQTTKAPAQATKAPA
jgi:hypothetical protein